MTAKKSNDRDLAPTIFVLFGATGDLAKRMVLPAFYRLNLEGLLPRQWLLVGNGRGDVAHEDFRKHVHDVLTEFGPKPEPAQWKPFAERLWFAGGGFTTDSPGSLLDDLAKGRTSRWAGIRSSCTTSRSRRWRSRRRPRRSASTGWSRTPGWSTRSRSARRRRRSGRWTRWSTRSWTSSRSTGSTTSWARRRPRTCTAALRERPVRRHVGPRARGVGADRRAGEARHHRPVGVLRRYRRGPGHAGHAPVPGGRRGRDGTAGQPGRAGPAGRPGEGDLLLPPARPGRGGARPVHRVPRRARGGGQVEHGHLRGGPAVDRQPPLARRAVLPAHRQAAGGDQAAGQPDPARARRARWPGSCPARPTCCRSPWPATARSTCR